ncbi:MAG: hypothetical protein M3Y87_24905 [Myxococcota bacterium]|nr:hypothetical protein [Myxococcota bacterium]
MSSHRAGLFVAVALCVGACSGGTSEQEEAPPEERVETGGESDGESGLPDSTGAERPLLTAEECTGQGGTVVGDIGDGATHSPDYLCPNGAPPIANVPLGVEGSVCCGP